MIVSGCWCNVIEIAGNTVGLEGTCSRYREFYHCCDAFSVVFQDDIDPSSFSNGRRGLVPLELLRNSNGERITIAKGLKFFSAQSLRSQYQIKGINSACVL